jgi:VanZ family protein
MKAFARYWLPPLLWMAAIFALSSDAGSAEHTSRFLLPLVRWLFPWASPSQIDAVHWLVRKLGHVVEYAVLAALWWRALRSGRGLAPSTSAWTALIIAVAWAVLDELHQSTVASRTASAADVVIDAAGAGVALLAARVRRARAARP